MVSSAGCCSVGKSSVKLQSACLLMDETIYEACASVLIGGTGCG